MEREQQLQCTCDDVCLILLNSSPVVGDSVTCMSGNDHAGKNIQYSEVGIRF